jgi:hypothetical protein
MSTEELKSAGNDLFRVGKYSEAADKYSEALTKTSDVDRELRTVLFANRECLWAALRTE